MRLVLIGVLALALAIGTFGWVGELLGRPGSIWFELAGFVLLIPTALLLKPLSVARFLNRAANFFYAVDRRSKGINK
jgi:uncharacterized membrane protein YccC